MADATHDHAIAIIGIALRCPGADDVDAFWLNLDAGIESITRLSRAQMLAAGADASQVDDPAWVPAGSLLERAECFDAGFFGYSPAEAERIDPQHRLFLECASAALESAGCVPGRSSGPIGVFAGCDENVYVREHLTHAGRALDPADSFARTVASERDYLATRVSHKLDLRGPSLDVQTACSTSLVCVHLACQSILTGECDVALAGAAALQLPQGRGYRHQPGMILSADGHCRPFDVRASGTVVGSGVGVVVLKRLSQALAERDPIWAILRGSAVNNDGARKLGFTAPSIEGQSEVIAAALDFAAIDPATIEYVEAHGTGTALGDPIEIAALTRAWRARSDRQGFCVIGSLKSNIGHLSTAAGVCGLIKAVLALHHERIPASLGFERANSAIDFANTPFVVAAQARPWPRAASPRRAAVSSFGIGGTNAHVVLEEAPRLTDTPRVHNRPAHVLVLSAKTAAALARSVTRLAEHLGQHPELELADVAFTLGCGRAAYAHRCAVIARDRAAAVRKLRAWSAPPAALSAVTREVAFVFAGQGDHYSGMIGDLYRNEAVFAEHFDRAAAALRAELALDLHELVAHSERTRSDTALAQPVTFLVQHALAQLWLHWGVAPRALLGHSLGEYTAACIAGVMSLPDALGLVCERGRLMATTAAGAMSAVSCSPNTLEQYLRGSAVSVAAINGRESCVLTGPRAQVESAEQRLRHAGIACARLPASHAFHGASMVPIAAAFAARVARVALSCPRIPVVSSMTGAWLSASEATDPQYWARQLRQPVRFAQALSRLDADLAILDIGPGRSLAAMTLAELGRRPAPVVAVNAWPPAQRADMESMLAAASRLWCSGVTLDWASFHGHGRKLPLPTYAFEPQRHWIERAPRTLPKEPDVRRWLYASAWQRSLPARPRAAEPILVLSDADEPSAAIIEALRAAGAEPIAVRTGSALDLPARGVCTVVPGEPSHFDALLQQLAAQGRLPWHVAHLWCVGPVDAASQDRAFYSLLNLAQAYAALRGGCSRQLRIDVVSTGVHDVGGDGNVDPDKALLLGPVLVVPQEIPAWSVRSIDLGEAPQDERAVSCVVAELLSSATDSVVALRGASRFVRAASPLQLSDSAPLALRDGGLYLVTGGLGGVGLCFARHLGQRARIRLLLTGRSEVPARAAWPQAWLDSARTVETAGSLFIPERADAADAAQMRRVLALAESRHGPVRGVIHAAAVAPGGAAVLKARSAATEVLRPKLEGVRVLESVLNPRSLDFFVLCSSVSSVQGGLGLVDYCAANAFLDAYAQQRRHRDATRVISVSWDGWRDVGMSADARIPLAARAPHQASSARAMTTSEGCQVLDTVLGLPLAHVIVSTHALEARLADSRVAGEVSVATSPGSDSPQREEARPRTATEQVLQQIWQALFGMPAVGIHDDFFELGGHSLIALRLVARVDAAFNLSVAPRALFDAPTIAGLAAFVDAARSPAEREREEFVV